MTFQNRELPKDKRYPLKPARPFGMPATPFDPRTGQHLGFDQGNVAVLTVVSEGYDVLLCDDRDGRRKLIAKPRHLRKSTFDGQTIGDAAYTSVSLGSRSATHASFPAAYGVWFSESADLYVAGETIVALRLHEHDRAISNVAEGELDDVDVGEHLLEWEDANVSGRRWDAGTEAEFTVVGDDAWDWINVTNANGDACFVAKPASLRPATWEAQTISGVTYSATDAKGEERTAANGVADDEAQVVTPSYYAGEKIKCVRSSFLDTGDGFPYFWEEIGHGREWAVEE